MFYDYRTWRDPWAHLVWHLYGMKIKLKETQRLAQDFPACLSWSAVSSQRCSPWCCLSCMGESETAKVQIRRQSESFAIAPRVKLRMGLERSQAGVFTQSSREERCWCVCSGVCAQLLSHVWLFVIPVTVACQTPLSMEFSRQEYWRGLPHGLPRLLQGNFLIQGSNSHLLHGQVGSLPPGHLGSPWHWWPRLIARHRDKGFTSITSLNALSYSPGGDYPVFLLFSSVQSLSCPTLCSLMDCSRPGFPVHQQPLELAQTQVYRVSDVIQPSLQMRKLRQRECEQLAQGHIAEV